MRKVERYENDLRKRDVKCIRKDSDPERKKEKDRETGWGD